MRNRNTPSNSALRAAAKKVFALIVVLFACSKSFAEQQIRVTPGSFNNTTVALAHVNGPTRFIFAPGEYFVTQPIEIPKTDGPVVLDGDGKAILSGGVAITNWKPAKLNGHNCLATDMPAVRMGLWYFRELWVNGKRATRARYPATGYLAATLPVDNKTPWNQGQNWFGYKPGDLPADLATSDFEAVVMNRWVESRLPISKIDLAAHRIESSKKSVFQLLDSNLYYLEGSDRFLTSPGDWYLDRAKGILYYLPRDGETADNLQAVAPRWSTMFQMRGASNVTFRGLTFSNTEWNLPDADDVGGFPQAAIGVPAAVSLQSCHGCRFESCTFQHLGNYALELGTGCQGNTVDHCAFTDIGAGAIKIGDGILSKEVATQSFGNTVTDCKITDGGKMFPSACGIWIGQSYDNRIEHNEIADLYYTAISAGWTWGYGQSLARGNHFEGNLVHHIGKKSNGDGPILSDMGGIYTLGVRDGTVISNNIFHDIAGRVYGGWGIYLDEGSSNVLIEKNLVYRTTHGGFHLHYGHNNIVQNNIFALGRDVQIARTRSEKETALTFKHNIVYWDSGVFTATDPAGLTFDENLYQCVGDTHLKFGDKTWPQWQAAGEDAKSILGDAGFTDPAKGDFTMRNKSAAAKIGFVPLAGGDAGVRGEVNGAQARH
jgi:parallel beta-helix repeat protein